MRRMGGLFKILPFTFTMVTIGSLALMGFPFLTGFYSKDVILEIAYSKYNFLGIFAYWLGILSAAVTSFYSFKLLYMTFLSSPNGFKSSIQVAHDSPFAMATPLFLLSLGSIFLGYLSKDVFIGIGTPFWNSAIFIAPQNLNIIDAEFIPILIKWVPFIVSFLSASASITLYHLFSENFFSLYYRFSFLRIVYVFFNKKWFLDRLQNEFIASTFLKTGYSITYKIIDKGVIELIGPTGFSKSTYNVSQQISYIQSGLVNHYAFFIFIFLIFFVSINFLLFVYGFFIDSQLYFIFLLSFILNGIYRVYD